MSAPLLFLISLWMLSNHKSDWDGVGLGVIIGLSIIALIEILSPVGIIRGRMKKHKEPKIQWLLGCEHNHPNDGRCPQCNSRS